MRRMRCLSCQQRWRGRRTQQLHSTRHGLLPSPWARGPQGQKVGRICPPPQLEHRHLQMLCLHREHSDPQTLTTATPRYRGRYALATWPASALKGRLIRQMLPKQSQTRLHTLNLKNAHKTQNQVRQLVELEVLHKTQLAKPHLSSRLIQLNPDRVAQFSVKVLLSTDTVGGGYAPCANCAEH